MRLPANLKTAHRTCAPLSPSYTFASFSPAAPQIHKPAAQHKIKTRQSVRVSLAPQAAEPFHTFCLLLAGRKAAVAL